MFGGVRLVDALSSRAPDPVDFGGSAAIMYTLSATADVNNSANMAVTVYRPGTTNPGSVTVNVTYEGGSRQSQNQNYQGEGHVRFNGAAAVDPGSFTLTNWVADPTGNGWRASIKASLTDQNRSSDDGNHINFYLKSTNSSDVIGPDGGQQFGIVNAIHCAAAPDAINCPTHTYILPFAPDCSVTNSGTAAVKVYDMDQGNPGIQPQHLAVKIIDTTTGATVNNDSYSGSESSSQTASFSFTYTPAHKYKAYFYNANIQNILQMTLPFDSVNAVIDCTEGQVTSSATQGCTALQGWMYDEYSPATALRYYVDVNPAGTPPASYATTPSGSTFAGPFTANLATPSTAPANVRASGNHGFKVTIPTDVNGHNYKGSWVPNHYYVYAKNASTNTYTRVDDLAVGVCTTVSCPAGSGGVLSNFSPQGVGLANSFHVGVATGGPVPNPSTNPPGNFSIKVTGPGLGAGTPYTAGPNASAPSAGHIYSSDVSFTPPLPGTYTVTWSYYGASSGCTTTSDVGFAPYFSVQGGDIAAGPGIGANCLTRTADITALNAGSPSYAGAGSEVGAWASGTLTNFVSGLGLDGGAAVQAGSGLAFANTGSLGSGNYGGGYGQMSCVTNYYAKAPTNGGTPWPGFGGIGGTGTHDYSVTTSLLTLSNGPALAPDTTVNLYVKGDVYINSDITYANYTLGHAPRFNLYVSGNIYIDRNVGELHGVYVAQVGASGSGNIDTCVKLSGATVVTSLPYGECKKDLTVVGSVISEGKLQLTRTFGNIVAAPGAPAAPAESFRYSPELWLTSGNASLDTQAYTSLPPVL
jgi:hypothetical protein